jgi:MoaA/NifB/PqqE/SkfB family radical SAM enzyme
MKSTSFCLAPWTHGLVHTDLTMRPCCVSTSRSDITFDHYKEWWNSSDMKKLRSDLFNGVKNHNCNACWKLEEQGKESLRLNYNNLFKKYVNFNSVVESANNNFILKDDPITWDLRLGNLCNLKCVMCNSTLSDKINQEIIDNKESIDNLFPNKLKINSSVADWTSGAKADEFFTNIRKTVRWLKLQGGEPLTVKNVRALIESLDKKQTTLAITTNGTILDKTLYNKLTNLDRIEFSISIEAVGPANDIIRYGSNWNQIKENILKLKELPNVDIQINHVLQITSVFYLKDVLQFSEEHGFHCSIIPLTDPEYLSLSACPREYLITMLNDINMLDIKHPKNQYIKDFITKIINETVFNKILWNEFHNYITLLDQLRPNRYSSVLQFKE